MFVVLPAARRPGEGGGGAGRQAAADVSARLDQSRQSGDGAESQKARLQESLGARKLECPAV